MRKSILFSFILASLFFATSCDKEQIFADKIQEELPKNPFAHLVLPEDVNIQISDESFEVNNELEATFRDDDNEFQNAEKEEPPKIYVDRVRPCEYGDCDPKVVETSIRLKKMANESCENKFGEILCCLEGKPAYILLIAEPDRINCIQSKNAPNNDNNDRTNEPSNVSRILNIGVHVEVCHRNDVFTLMVYDKNTFEPFEGRRYGVDWFENDRYIDSGSQLDCITGEEITVLVQDFVEGTRAIATVRLPNDDPSEIMIDKGNK